MVSLNPCHWSVPLRAPSYQDLEVVGDKMCKISRAIKESSYVLRSSIYCLNYSKGFYASPQYGRPLLNWVTEKLLWVEIPVYIRSIRQLVTGELFNNKVHLIAASLFRLMGYTAAYVGKSHELSASFSSKGLQAGALVNLREFKNLTLSAAYGIIAYDHAKRLYEHPERRTVVSVFSLLIISSFSVLMAASTLGARRLRIGAGLVLNISTVVGYTLEYAPYFLKKTQQ
jgi:hypothetical protein